MSAGTGMNCMEKLASEIARVSELKSTYESLSNLPGCNVQPVIRMITEALDRAVKAAGTNDVTPVIRSIRELEEFEG